MTLVGVSPGVSPTNGIVVVGTLRFETFGQFAFAFIEVNFGHPSVRPGRVLTVLGGDCEHHSGVQTHS